jgi:acetylornithine deacetylase/succinyl-diaminopimelate desuccinylase-like protein
VVVEGQEEVGSVLNEYPATAPDLFAADAMLIADMGSVRPGVPTLTIGLRGMGQLQVEVETLAGPKHSGQYGGAAPDALGALLRALASLHDDDGDVAVEGLRREPWTGVTYTEDEFRALAEVLPGMPLVGTGDLGSRVWSGPAITVIGIDVASVEGALNAVNSRARAKISIRVHPGQDAREALDAVIRHLEAACPWGIQLTVSPIVTGNGFLAETTGPAYQAAREAMHDAWGIDASYAASGGSIPLVSALHEAVPDAEILLLGTTDGYANIHAPNERVLADEFEKAVAVETAFFGRFAEDYAARGGGS